MSVTEELDLIGSSIERVIKSNTELISTLRDLRYNIDMAREPQNDNRDKNLETASILIEQALKQTEVNNRDLTVSASEVRHI